jgi:hypothetical protein
MADERSASDYADNVVTHPSGFRKGPSGHPCSRPEEEAHSTAWKPASPVSKPTSNT